MCNGPDDEGRHLLVARHHLVEPGQTPRQVERVARRAGLDEFLARLPRRPRAPHLVGGEQLRTGGHVQTRQRLRGRRQDDRTNVLTLERPLNTRTKHSLERVGLGRPLGHPHDEFTHDIDGDLGALQRRAGPGATHARLGGGLRRPSAQRVVPAQLGTRLAGSREARLDLGDRRERLQSFEGAGHGHQRTWTPTETTGEYPPLTSQPHATMG